MEGPATLADGTVFHDRYRVLRRIKSGGMGAVYEVLDEKTDKQRALKVMLPSALEEPDFRARFEREARITGAIESDHIVHVSDAGVDGATGVPFLVMELLRGEELAALVRRAGPRPPAEVAIYLFQTALALDKTHAAGIVHRDLKPENLFLTRADDGAPRVKILDFGIAKVLAPDGSSNTTRALGTPKYMAPEQVRGERSIGPRTDIYALGHVAYALLVGEHYWAADIPQGGDSLFNLLLRIVEGAAESPTERALRRRGVTLPPGFDAWFFQATAVDPERRFARASAAVAALGQALGVPGPWTGATLAIPGTFAPPVVEARTAVLGDEVRTPSLPGAEPGTGNTWGSTVGADRRRKRTGLLAGGAAAVLAVGLTVGFLATRTPAAEPEAPAVPAAAPPPASAAPQTTAPTIEPQPLPATAQPQASAGTSPPAPSADATDAATSARAAAPPAPVVKTAGKTGSASAPGAASPAATASPAKPPSASGIVDPWAAKPAATPKPAAAPPASTRPGMF